MAARLCLLIQRLRNEIIMLLTAQSLVGALGRVFVSFITALYSIYGAEHISRLGRIKESWFCCHRVNGGRHGTQISVREKFTQTGTGAGGHTHTHTLRGSPSRWTLCGNVLQIGAVCAEMMGRGTDGQESIPWATSLLLTTQPCQLHSPHLSPPLLHPLRYSTDISSLLFHAILLCYQVIPTYSPSIALPLTSPRPLPPFSSSASPGRNRLSAKLRPNPLIFLHVVTARAAIPLFLRPFLLCWASGQLSDLRLAATCCNFTSSHVGAAH